MAAAAPLAWATIPVVDNCDQPCVEAQGSPLDPATHWGLLVLHPLGKLLALSYIYHLNEKTNHHSWLAKE